MDGQPNNAERFAEIMHAYLSRRSGRSTGAIDAKS
jgi:hypothetical protein